MLFKNNKRGHTLVSAHIPKAGGTSFRSAIEANYADSKTLFVYDSQALELVRLAKPGDLKKIKAIHGHFPPSGQLLSQLENPYLVTWLRNPIDRLVSLYSYWKTLEPSGMAVHDQFVETQPTIAEFSTWPAISEEVINYFSEIPITNYDFVGIVENYEADLKTLAELLGWKHAPVVWTNKTKAKHTLHNDERGLIEESLSESIELYNGALKQRNLVHLAA